MDKYNGVGVQTWLTPDCIDEDPMVRRSCIRVPLDCTRLNVVYNLLHYIIDGHYLPKNVS